MNERTSTFSNSLLWFGAAVSIAEILTGTLIAPLGFGKGIAAVLLGHLIGCALLFFAGLIGAKSGKSAMETTAISFGKGGAKAFSFLNIVQLAGWTAIMLDGGANAALAASNTGTYSLWTIVIGVLIAIWLLSGIKNLGKLNLVAMLFLFLLTCALSVNIFNGGAAEINKGGISFAAAVELSVAMPLSWLPLISDYTKNAKKPFSATLASALTYFAVSSWMYIIGMGAVIFTGETDISAIMMKAGFGVAALFIVILSTVTTTFLDVYSAGVSAETLSPRLKEKPFAIGVTFAGVLLAMFTPIGKIEGFLYFIGSVFAPMIAILITDYFILSKSSAKSVDVTNFVIWLIGFVLYRICMNFETPVGYTLPVMLTTAIITIVVNKTKERLT